MLSRWISKLSATKTAIPPVKKSPSGDSDQYKIFDQYVSALPTHQNAVNLVPGWNCSFPPEFNIQAGHLATYQDPRIAWALSQFGSIENKTVLELGPLEGGHSVMLERAGAFTDSIEANRLAYLRCLITKEIFSLTRCRFWLGDFMQWLEHTDRTYDLIVASGVLYHVRDPLRLIELIAKRTNVAYFWTHFFHDTYMPVTDPRRHVFAAEPEIRDFHGIKVKSYLRTYLGADKNAEFCGGLSDEHRWLDRDDLLSALKAVGFSEIILDNEEPQHTFGPAISIFARKS
jgi:hypothetical protein